MWMHWFTKLHWFMKCVDSCSRGCEFRSNRNFLFLWNFKLTKFLSHNRKTQIIQNDRFSNILLSVATKDTLNERYNNKTHLTICVQRYSNRYKDWKTHEIYKHKTHLTICVQRYSNRYTDRKTHEIYKHKTHLTICVQRYSNRYKDWKTHEIYKHKHIWPSVYKDAATDTWIEKYTKYTNIKYNLTICVQRYSNRYTDWKTHEIYKHKIHLTICVQRYSNRYTDWKTHEIYKHKTHLTICVQRYSNRYMDWKSHEMYHLCTKIRVQVGHG